MAERPKALSASTMCEAFQITAEEWADSPALRLTDAAAMHLGATCFSVYNASSPEQVEYVVGDAGNRGARHRAGLPRHRARRSRAGRQPRARRRDRRRGA